MNDHLLKRRFQVPQLAYFDENRRWALTERSGLFCSGGLFSYSCHRRLLAISSEKVTVSKPRPVAYGILRTYKTRQNSHHKSMDVLLVEDNPGDIRLMQLVFHEVFSSVRLHFANDGVEAMAFLRREGPNAKAPRPDFIVLDLNMPKMDGRELLAEIKNDAALRSFQRSSSPPLGRRRMSSQAIRFRRAATSRNPWTLVRSRNE